MWMIDHVIVYFNMLLYIKIIAKMNIIEINYISSYINMIINTFIIKLNNLQYVIWINLF